MTKMGRVLGVNKSAERIRMKESIGEANFIENFGVEGDAHAGNWHKQVSLLGTESVKKMEALGATGMTSGMFAENIRTEGIILYELPIGTKLRIGDTIQEVTKIGKESCEESQLTRTFGDCIVPNIMMEEGIFTKVISGGMVKVGDEIEVIE